MKWRVAMYIQKDQNFIIIMYVVLDYKLKMHT